MANKQHTRPQWRGVSLGDLVDIKHGFAFKGDYIHDEPPGDILLTPGNFAIGGGFKGERLKYFNGDAPEEYVLCEGDLLVTMTDLSKQADTLGYPALVPLCEDDRRFLHNQRLGKVLLKGNCDVDARFLYYVMCSSEYRHEVLASATGTTVKHTSPDRIRQFRFPLPPLPEQRAIAHVLGTLDDKIELNRRMNETLEEMARALFKSWFVDFDPVRAKMEGRWRRGESLTGLPAELYDLFPDRLVGSELGEIPEGWEVKALGELCTLRAGSAFPKASQGKTTGKYPFVKVRDMNLTGNSVGILDATNWVDDDDMKQLKGHHFPRETTVFAKIGEGLKQNRIRTLTRPTLIDNNMMGAVPNTDIIKPLILFHVLSQFDFGEIAGGTALPYLTAGALRSLLVPVPHLKQQIPAVRFPSLYVRQTHSQRN